MVRNGETFYCLKCKKGFPKKKRGTKLPTFCSKICSNRYTSTRRKSFLDKIPDEDMIALIKECEGYSRAIHEKLGVCPKTMAKHFRKRTRVQSVLVEERNKAWKPRLKRLKEKGLVNYGNTRSAASNSA